MALTKKDYELIATAIARARGDEGTKLRVAEELADKLKEENSRFERGRFLRACGVVPDRIEYPRIIIGDTEITVGGV